MQRVGVSLQHEIKTTVTNVFFEAGGRLGANIAYAKEKVVK